MAKVQNRERLLRKLAALPQRARAEIGAALRESGSDIAALARQRAPKASGDLARSVRVVSGTYAPKGNVRGMGGKGAGDPELTVRVVAGDEKAWYARLVEFGTAPHLAGGIFKGAQHPGTRPYPFFFSSYRLLRRRVRTKISRATRKAAREAARS